METEFPKHIEGERVYSSLATPHRFFQHDERRQGSYPSSGSLLKQFTKLGGLPSDANTSNIVNCSFCPTDDNVLIVGGHVSGTTSGCVQLWDLEGYDDLSTPVPVSSNFFTYSPLPACQFSSNGELVLAILNNGISRLTILAMDEENGATCCELHCGGKNVLRGRVKCCVFSQDNRKAVTISTVGCVPLTTFNTSNTIYNDICIWRVTSRQSMKNIWQRNIQVLCPEFKGKVHSCVLSPNGDYLATSSTSGQFFVLDCTIFETVVTTNCKCLGQSNGSLTCLFNPRFACKLIFCHNNTWCCYHDFELGLHSTGVTCQIVKDRSVTAVACTFSPDGEIFALALSTATVVLCDADSLQQMFEINPNFLPVPRELGAFSVAITRSCQELAVGYSGSIVCVWQLPPKLDLKHICRLAILRLVPPKAIILLPLPRKLKLYLLYAYQGQPDFKKS